MSFADVLTATDAHLISVGAALTPAMLRVQRGEPFAVPDYMIAYWYDGDAVEAETLARKSTFEELTIRCYWPVPNRDSVLSASLETSVEAANRALQAAFFGDSYLKVGGVASCIGLEIGPGRADWVELSNGVWARVLTLPLRVDMGETEMIAT